MKYSIQFGTLATPPKNQTDANRFRICILGDFSGRGNRGAVSVGQDLADRKPLKVDSDNLDDMLARLNIKLHLPAGPEGAIIEVPIQSLEDFHPDRLYESVPLFERLVNLRAKLQDPATFEKASAALKSLAIAGAAPAGRKKSSESTTIPRMRLDSLGDLLTKQPRSATASDLKSLLQNVVGPHIVPDMVGQEAMLAALDDALSELMCTILHHPDFQALESIWRSIDLLVHRLELDHELELVLCDITAAEVAADLASTDDLQQTGLYSLLVEKPAEDAQQGPFALVIGNYVFEKIPPHAELLARMAQLAANGNFAFVSSMDKPCIDIKPSDDVPPVIAEAWQALCAMPQASYVALTTPRFMLRWPYGKKTEPIESFAFEEFSAVSGVKGMLWGNSAILAALLIGHSYRQDGLKEMKLGSMLTVDDIPFYYYTDQHGDQVALPCTERLVGERLAKNVSHQRFIPVLSMKGSNDVRLGGLGSLAGKSLAGWWDAIPDDQRTAAVSVPSGGVSLAPAPAAKESSVTASEPAASDGLDDLDDLLADLDAPAEPAAASTPNETPAPSDDEAAGGLDDLDSLLADLDSQDEAKEATQGEVDNELMDLLNDL